MHHHILVRGGQVGDVIDQLVEQGLRAGMVGLGLAHHQHIAYRNGELLGQANPVIAEQMKGEG